MHPRDQPTHRAPPTCANDLKLNNLVSGRAPRTLLDTLAKAAGTNAKGLIRNLTAGGVTYAMYPGDTSVWIIDAQDARALDPLQQFVKAMTGGQHLASPASTKTPTPFYQEYPGDVAAWSLDGKQFFSRAPGNRAQSWLLSRDDTLKVLFLLTPDNTLAASPLYRQAKLAAAGNSAAWAYLNMAALNQAPAIQKEPRLPLTRFDSILNGAWKQSLRDAHWLGDQPSVSKAKAARRSHT